MGWYPGSFVVYHVLHSNLTVCSMHTMSFNTTIFEAVECVHPACCSLVSVSIPNCRHYDHTFQNVVPSRQRSSDNSPYTFANELGQTSA